MPMKKDLKKIEQFIRKLRKEPGADFTNKLADELCRKHPHFQQNNNNFSWNIINLININMKKNTIGLALFMTLLVSGGIFLHLNLNSESRIANVFLEKAYAKYEKIIQNNFYHEIELKSGKDFEDYLAIFDSEDNIDLGVELREYGRPTYIFNMVSSPNVDLYYENDHPILKIKNNSKTKYFEYSLEKGFSPGENAWEEIFPKTSYNHEGQILNLIKNLKNDKKTTILKNNEDEIIFSRPTDIDLGTGDTVFEEYYFNKKDKELIKKEEVTTNNDKKYVLRIDIISRTETNDETLSFTENENLISLSAEQYYYAGGANGFAYFATFNYDKNNEKILTISDIFKNPQKGLQKLSDYSREKLPNTLEYPDKEMIADGTKPTAKNFSQFNFSQNENKEITGINLHFTEYQVAPGCEGATDLFVPLNVVGDLLK